MQVAEPIMPTGGSPSVAAITPLPGRARTVLEVVACLQALASAVNTQVQEVLAERPTTEIWLTPAHEPDWRRPEPAAATVPVRGLSDLQALLPLVSRSLAPLAAPVAKTGWRLARKRASGSRLSLLSLADVDAILAVTLAQALGSWTAVRISFVPGSSPGRGGGDAVILVVDVAHGPALVAGTGREPQPALASWLLAETSGLLISSGLVTHPDPVTPAN